MFVGIQWRVKIKQPRFGSRTEKWWISTDMISLDGVGTASIEILSEVLGHIRKHTTRIGKMLVSVYKSKKLYNFIFIRPLKGFVDLRRDCSEVGSQKHFSR